MNITLVKVIVEGPAGVGKTCLMYLLLSKPPPDKRHSTGCAERAIRVIRVGKEGEEWNEISTKEFQEMIAEAVPILYKELRAKGLGMEELEKVLSNLEVGEGEGEGKEGGEKEGREDDGEEEVSGVRVEVGKGDGGKANKEKKPSAEKVASPGEEEGKAVIDGVITKLTRLVSGGKSSRRLLEMELIYLMDTGGQQPFWDLIPIFTHDTSATLFVHRLCEKLGEHPLNNLFQEGEQVGLSERATLTTEQAFKTMLRGLHEGGKRSKVIAVGTHRDLIEECEETIDEKNTKFAAIASPHFEEDMVFRNEDMKQIVFPLNTKAPEDVDKKEASKIRASIEKGATQHKIPIWWFVLQLILEALAHKLGRDVLSKDECLHVSKSLGFSEGQLDAALAFFNKLNIFLFKKDFLPRVVFTNPQVPLDKLSKLVEQQYHLKSAEANPTKSVSKSIGGEWKKFRDSGILTLKLLEEFKSHYVKGIFTARDFLLLLEKLLVVSPLSATEYFFPAVLSMTPESWVKQFLVSCKARDIAALVVEFPTGWAPPGVYCCSVCHLQSHTGWEVVHRQKTPPDNKDTTDTQLCKISRNSITFSKRSDRPGTVTFIDNFSFFIACVNVDTSKMDREELVEHCQSVQSELFAAVEAGLDNTHHKNSRPIPAFLCPIQNDSCSTELHPARISQNGKKWICSENANVFDKLSTSQTLWLTGSGKQGITVSVKYHNDIVFSLCLVATPSKSSAPKLRDLANCAAAIIPHKWKQVAIQLELSKGERKAIEKDEDECFDRFMAVLEQWKQSASLPYTWKTLITALKSTSVDEQSLAEQLQRDFC